MKKGIALNQFIGEFNIVPMETNTDHTLLTLEQCRDKLLESIDYNIGQFRKGLWTRATNVRKILTEIDPKQHLCIFTLRIGNTEIYKCHLILIDLVQKLEFLGKFYAAVSNGCLDQSILAYVQKRQAQLIEQRQKKADKRKAKRLSEREIRLKAEAKIIRNLPKATYY